MEKPEKHHKHILVVESNEDDAYMVRRALGDLPFCTSFLCRSLGEARAYLSGEGIYKDRENYPPADAVITELRLGPDSGYELLIWIRETKALRELPLYVLAGVVSPLEEANLRGLRVRRVIAKPAGLAELKRVVRELADEVCSS